MTTQRYDLSRLAATGKPRSADAANTVTLDESWRSPGTRIHLLAAPGGAGKTTLVNHWLAKLEEEGFPGADQVLGWTFHGQGSGPAAASCDAFLDHALRSFGDVAPRSGSPWDRGMRLARLAQARRTLLVLDGVDTQQVEDGKTGWKFSHPALTALVTALGRHNPGLCLITGRNGVSDLDGNDGVAPARDPDGLDPKNSKPVLKRLKKLPDPARSLLRILSLFEGPATRGSVKAVIGESPIRMLTEGLSGEGDLEQAIRQLQGAELLLAPEADGAGSGSEALDVPRVVREEAGKGLDDAARKEGHRRLYEYFDGCQPHLPATLEETLPLCTAVRHACEAGEVAAAYHLYKHRVVREPEYFSTFRLGAFAAEDASLRAFFEEGWKKLQSGVEPEDESTLRLAAAVNLRSLGRLGEALTALGKPSGKPTTEMEAERAADLQSCRSEILLAQGKIEEAIEAAERAVKHADHSKNGLRRTAKRAYLADARHQAGRLVESMTTFREAEREQAAWQPAFPLLYSLRGYQYGDLLLREPEASLLGPGPRPSSAERRRLAGLVSSVGGRLEMLRSWREAGDSALDRGLERVLQGRVWLALALADPDGDDELLREARSDLDEGVRLLREYAALYRLPFGLLARAAFYRVTEEAESARKDLEEALGIAKLSGMPLLEADVMLELARLEVTLDDRSGASKRLEEGARLVDRHHYHRRDREVAVLAATL